MRPSYDAWLAAWAPQHSGKEPPTKEQFEEMVELLDISAEDLGMAAVDEVARADAGYSSLPGAAEDEATSMAARARRGTCIFCRHGDHEISLGEGESCDCPCHGPREPTA